MFCAQFSFDFVTFDFLTLAVSDELRKLVHVSSYIQRTYQFLASYHYPFLSSGRLNMIALPSHVTVTAHASCHTLKRCKWRYINWIIFLPTSTKPWSLNIVLSKVWLQRHLIGLSYYYYYYYKLNCMWSCILCGMVVIWVNMMWQTAIVNLIIAANGAKSSLELLSVIANLFVLTANCLN